MGLKLLFLINLLAAAMAASEAQSLPGCPDKCGEVVIPYPFGVGLQPGTSRYCFLDYQSLFNLTCHNSMLYFFNAPVSNISLQQSQMDISMIISKDCYNQSRLTYSYSLNTGAFTISSTQNKFITIGCDAVGYFGFTNYLKNNFTSYGGCVAKCDTPPPDDFSDKTCSGTGCCEVDFRAGINYIDMQASSLSNHTNVSSFNNCTYAMVVKRDWFSFSLDYLRDFPYDEVPVVLDWTVSNDTCQNASSKADYACKYNSVCVDSIYGAGYNCKCKSGFEGNPYHPDGCHDIDECVIPNICPAPKKCHNYPGYYNCSCPPGLIDTLGVINGTACTTPQRSNNHNLLTLIALGVSVALLLVFTMVSTLCWARKQRTLKQLRQKNFEQNGGNLLLQQLSQEQGYTNQTKIFTEIDLKNATSNFDESRILGRGGQGIVYKGILLDNTIVAIKKSRAGGDPKQIKDFINEVFVLSQINHRNVVKLLGCCLETDVPLLVYEFVDNGTLLDHIDPLKNEISISWEIRLKIAAETANAISYLHSYATIPIIHRDIKSTNILLDHNLIAKVSDFGASRLVPIDETHVTTVVQGTIGYLDPEYLHIGQLNEKSDVYSFGVVLVELLTGNKVVELSRVEEKYLAKYFVSSMKEDRLQEILDKRVLNKKNKHQMKEVALLAKRCVGVKGEERPTMKEVAKELEGMIAVEKIAMEKHAWVKGEDMSEESEYLLSHMPDGASTSATCDSIMKEIAFEIEGGR